MRILLSGGGTAGHVLPHRPVLDALKRRLARREKLEILYVGSRKGPERALVEGWGWSYRAIAVGKWRRYVDWRNVIDPFLVMGGVAQAWRLIGKFKPNVVFSKGGYASVPVLLAAYLRKVPIVIHDSDAIPGLTTRLVARFADVICLGYKEAAAPLSHIIRKRNHAKVVVTGIPLRENITKGKADRGRAKVGFTDKLPIVLVMGGSSGAQKVNEAVWGALPELTKVAQVVHVTGRGKGLHEPHGLQKSKKLSKKFTTLNRYRAFDYLDKELPDFIAMADLIVSRAGASTIAEFSACKKPMILIPLGTGASHGDQIENARVLAKEKGAEVIYEKNLTPKKLANVVQRLLADHTEVKPREYLEKMGRRAYEGGGAEKHTRAAEHIAEILVKVLYST